MHVPAARLAAEGTRQATFKAAWLESTCRNIIEAKGSVFELGSSPWCHNFGTFPSNRTSDLRA